jgi:outer membrane protein assembly factor BamB
MATKPRLALTTAGALAFLVAGLFVSSPSPAQVEVKKVGKKAVGVAPPVKPKDGVSPASEFSAIKLQENSTFRGYFNVARACIEDKDWAQAVQAVQLILDNREDFFAKVETVGPDGKKMERWTSVKFEANNLLGSMPQDGLDMYEQKCGASAKTMLEEAKKTSNHELLGEVAQRYLHTKAGIEANELLATYFMDRGQFFMAALRYDKLLGMSAERAKIDDLTLYKAVLSYRRAGDVKKADAAWRKLEPRLRDKGGLRVGTDVVEVAKLQELLDETPRSEASSPYDWPYIRGNVANSAQAQGTPPLLDVVLFKRETIKEKHEDGDDEKGVEAKERIEAAIKQALPNNPVLPGFFPIASNNLLIYRSYHDVRAVYLQDEKDAKGEVVAKAGTIAWKSTDFDGALANVLADGKLRVPLQKWLQGYFGTGTFSSLVYENTLNGTLSTDHRFVYAIDDLAVPAPPAQFSPHLWNSGDIGQDVKPRVLQNTLYAFNLRLGNCLWRLGGMPDEQGRVAGAQKEDPFADSHFLGPPISVGGKLYVLNEKGVAGPTGNGELRLVCIDPYKLAGPGRPTVIEPIQSLGDVLQQHRITHDVARRLNAVHLAYGEGILVCPTNAGEVLGVDLMSRSLAWAYPYRDQMPTSLPMAFAGNPQIGLVVRGGQQVGGSLYAPTWRSAPPVIQEGKVVFTAPDANSIHCINLRDGTPIWKKRQADNDLYFAGVYAGKVLIVGKSAIRALSLDDGRQLWYIPTGAMPSGQGVASRNIYYLPLRKDDKGEKGEIMAIDIEKGQVKAHNTGGAAPGNLIFYEGAVISQTPTQVVVYPQLASRLQLAQAALRADPENPTKLLELGELLLADGQTQGAVDDLQKALAKQPAEPMRSRARLKLYDALTDLLSLDFVGASGRYLNEYRELCNVPENAHEQQLRQARYFRIVGQGREAEGNLVEAFQNYREFGSLPIHREQGGIASLDDPSHKVPTNVWLRGRVAAMIAKATPEQRQPLEKKIAEEWKTVEGKKDIDAIRSFVGMFDVPFAVGREARLRLAELIIEINDRGNFLEAELSLQQLRGAGYRTDPLSGGRALAALARLEEKKGSVESMKLAAAYYRELNRDFAAVPVRVDNNVKRTGADLFNELATDPRFRPYLEEPGSPWGNTPIGVRELPGATSSAGTQGLVLYPEGDLSSVARQQRLVLDMAKPSSAEVRLVDLTTNSIRWAQPLGSFPQTVHQLFQQTQSNTAYSPNARYRFYQVKGNLLVLQVGTVVYALDAGTGKMLWQHNLMEGEALTRPVMQPGMAILQILPDAEGYLNLVVFDQLTGQRTTVPIGHVGAVQASHVALVTTKGLMVLDPLRGALLWKKMDVHPSTRVFGDEEHLFLVDVSNGIAGATRVVRASDGVEITAGEFGTLYQNRVKVLGRRILAAVPGRDHLTMKLHDLVLGKDVWSKNFDPKAVVLQTDDPTLTGVITPDGTAIALDVGTGAELLNAKVVYGRVTPADVIGLKDPLLLRDAERFYVALNKPVDGTKVANGFVMNNFQSAVRCAPVNGWFVALHRQAGQRQAGDKTVTWKAGDFHWHSYTPLANQLVILEQFDQLPILLFSSRHNDLINAGAGGYRAIYMTQSINKRNGKMIFDPGPRAGQPNAPQFTTFSVDLKNGTINMVGFTAIVQHYLDDGRKPADVPGINVSGVGNPYSGAAGNPYLPQGDRIGRLLPANVAPAQAVPAVPAAKN